MKIYDFALFDELLEVLSSQWHMLSQAERATLVQKWRILETLELKTVTPQL